jgi:hypothetical protein
MKESRVTGKPNLSVSMNSTLAVALAKHAKADKTTQSEALDGMVEQYLKKTKLQPLPNGAKLQRSMAGGGESKLSRYWLDASTLELLAEAEKIGYSRSFIIEESIKKGLAAS